MEELLNKLDRSVDELAAAGQRGIADAAGLYARLQASENYLIEAYQHSSAGDTGARPTPTVGGTMELGPVLHLLNHPPLLVEPLVIRLVRLLELIEEAPLPPSAIDKTMWNAIEKQSVTGGVVGNDGTVFGIHPYEQLDPGWLISFGWWVHYLLNPTDIHPFGESATITKVPGAPESIRIGVVGDWGTGRYVTSPGGYCPDGGPALAVMAAMQAPDITPDYLLHLGDVYYAGLASEEQGNFLDHWPATWGPSTKTAYTLNSNHEMYDGANAYFEVALAPTGPFSAQNGASFSALIYGDWTILCLDSAYFADPLPMYMTGGLGPADGAQLSWVTKHFSATKGDKVIVLTHHNPMNTAGDALDGDMFDALTAALGGAPAYWYFGHTHNGVVYPDDSCMGKLKTKARLCGHGAIPFGDAWVFDQPEDTAVPEYYSHTPVTGSAPLVYNGFATIELTAAGEVSETFYELTDAGKSSRVAWTSAAVSH